MGWELSEAAIGAVGEEFTGWQLQRGIAVWSRSITAVSCNSFTSCGIKTCCFLLSANFYKTF